jgi:hypothetical protein
MSNRRDHDYPDDTNDTDTVIPYDDSFSEEDFIAELIAEGYSKDEARRMAGDYDPEDYYGSDDSGERDIPDMPDMGEFDADDILDEEDYG